MKYGYGYYVGAPWVVGQMKGITYNHYYNIILYRQVTRGKAKSGAVVKHQRKLVVLETTSNVKGHCTLFNYLYVINKIWKPSPR